jgi:hypothetical protein
MGHHERQAEDASLAEVGATLVALLCAEEFQAVAARFPYALANGREPAQAIEQDLRSCLEGLQGSTRLVGLSSIPPRVKHFIDQELVALIECIVATDQKPTVLVELIVLGHGHNRSVCLEQISAGP